jgi:hypothetical protein
MRLESVWPSARHSLPRPWPHELLARRLDSCFHSRVCIPYRNLSSGSFGHPKPGQNRILAIHGLRFEPCQCGDCLWSTPQFAAPFGEDSAETSCDERRNLWNNRRGFSETEKYRCPQKGRLQSSQDAYSSDQSMAGTAVTIWTRDHHGDLGKLYSQLMISTNQHHDYYSMFECFRLC